MPPALPADPDALAWAGAAVRRYAAATNLLVAGRRFRVVGTGTDAAVLAHVLTALGSRHAPDGPVDQLWCTGDPAASAAAVDALVLPRGSTVVVVDAGRHVPAVDEEAFGPTVLVRPGVLGVPHHADGLFLVSTGREPEQDGAASLRIRWAGRSLPVSRAIAAELRADRLLAGVRVGVAMVLEPKTAVLALLLQDAGADVVVYAHADETDDAVADALRDAGLVVFASSGATLDEQRRLALEMLDREPQVLLDDGAHVIRLLHEARPELLPGMIGATEETTSGLRPLRVMAGRGELRLPVVAVNDARAKTSFDNRYGTGQSTVFAVFDLLDAVTGHRARMPGGTAAVIGHGPVGEGVAQVLRALGYRVVVAETDPVRALQAVFAGHEVAPVLVAVAEADLVVSATGVRDTVSLAVLRACAPDAVVAVAGGVDGEVAVDDVTAAGGVRTPVAPHVDRMTVPGADGDVDGTVLLVDGGGCVNLTAAEGNPIEIMDLSFAVQLGAVRMLLERGAGLPVGVHPVDPAVDDHVASAALTHLGLTTDRRTTARADERGAGSGPDDVRTTRFGAVR